MIKSQTITSRTMDVWIFIRQTMMANYFYSILTSDLGELYTSAAIRLHRSLEKTKEEVTGILGALVRRVLFNTLHLDLLQLFTYSLKWFQ